MDDLCVNYALFDMDGTLADTMGYWCSLAREALARHGVTLGEEDVRTLGTMTFGQGLAYLKEKEIPCIDKITREDILSILADHYRKDAVLKKGARQYLDALKARGARMAVATLTPGAQAKVCLESLDIARYFDFVLTGDDYPRGKSSPDIFVDAAKRFGCELAEMHLYEDSLYSMKTAYALGISVVGVADPWQEHLKDEILAVSVAYFEDGFARRIK